MVRLKAPLFSMEASGTIANSIVFSKWKGRDYARRHAVPSNPRTGLQVGVRAVFGFLSRAYATLSGAFQAGWAEIAENDNTLAINALIARGVAEARQNHGWSIDPDGDASSSPDDAIITSSTAQIRSIRHVLEGNQMGDDFSCFAIHRVEGATFDEGDVGIDNLVGVVPGPRAAGAQTWTDVGLTTGQAYSYRARCIGIDGALGVTHPALDITPL